MTCSSSELVGALTAAGCQVVLAGERLIVRPAHKVPATLVAELRAHKPALIAYLNSRPVCAECDQPLDPQPWSAADWRELFDERLAVALIDGEMFEIEARRQAWWDTVTRWQEMHPGTTRDQAATALRALVRGEASAAPSPGDTAKERAK